MRGRRVAFSLLLSIAMLGTASAAPATVDKGFLATSNVVDVQYRGPHHTYRGHTYRGRPHPRYRPGYRYRSAPRGWHRYHARPRDWRSRGCVIVGPVWFCP